MGYWPSFNVPFYPAIAHASGFTSFAAELQSRGAEWREAAAALSHQLAPRATLFRRDVGTVTDLASLKQLMRSNNFRHDPVSLETGCDRGRDSGLPEQASKMAVTTLCCLAVSVAGPGA